MEGAISELRVPDRDAIVSASLGSMTLIPFRDPGHKRYSLLWGMKPLSRNPEITATPTLAKGPISSDMSSHLWRKLPVGREEQGMPGAALLGGCGSCPQWTQTK